MNPKIFDTDCICNEYIKDLDAFIKKWYHDYDLSEKFSNNITI